MSDQKNVIGYVRVSTDKQVDSGAGLTVQRQAIQAECKRQKWNLVEIVSDDGESAATLNRPGIKRVLEELSCGKHDALVVAKQDRLSRTVRDVIDLMELSVKERWGLVILDMQIDTTTPIGEAMAITSSTFAQLERRVISLRTIAALAVKKAEGVKLGRKFDIPDYVIDIMRRHRRNGKSYSVIARLLDEQGVPTARGGSKWYPVTVQKALVARRTSK